MPYIKKVDREMHDRWLEDMPPIINIGEINYIITKILMRTNPQYYTDFNALIGLLECCKLEMYRMAVAPYEDKKKQENGNVY